MKSSEEMLRLLKEQEKSIKEADDKIAHVENIQFTEQRDGDGVIGYINDYNRIVQVSFLEDNLGQYLRLSYPIKSSEENIRKSIPYLSRWFVNGRYKIEGDSIVVYSVLPIIEEVFLSKQITHALSEIWDMNNVVNSTCK